MTNTTKVYFVGGILAGTSQEIAEPLPSVWNAADTREEKQPAHSVGSTGPNEPLKVDNYILHTLALDAATRVRAYIHIDLQYGGLTPDDLAHIPR